jgi:hypothetical protein
MLLPGKPNTEARHREVMRALRQCGTKKGRAASLPSGPFIGMPMTYSVAYLNSGMAFSSSAVPLIMA